MADFISDKEFESMEDAPEIVSDKDFESLPDFKEPSKEEQILALGQGPIRIPEEEKPEPEVISDDDFDKLDEYQVPKRTSGFESGVLGFQEGATLGFADEIMGGVKALGEKVGLAESQRSVFDEDTLAAEYQAQRDKYRQYQKTAQQENPEEYLGGQVVGGISSGIATAGIGPEAWAAKAGIEGAAYGLGSSEADLFEGEFGEAALDTAKGGAAGLMLPASLKGLKYAGKGLKGAGKVLTGTVGKVDDLAVEGASEILGVAKKELTPDVVEYLKHKGLGVFNNSKDDILKEINKDIKLLEVAGGGKTDMLDKVLKVKGLIENAEIGLTKEAVRAGKKMSPTDIAATLMGPKGYVAKKARDVASSRFKLKAPEMQKFGEKLTKIPSRGTKEAYETVTKGVTSPGGQRPFIQTVMDLEGTKYQNLFGEDNQQNAVRHNLLMNNDPEYRQLMLNKEEQE